MRCVVKSAEEPAGTTKATTSRGQVRARARRRAWLSMRAARGAPQALHERERERGAVR